jgi:hypothetical protein
MLILNQILFEVFSSGCETRKSILVSKRSGQILSPWLVDSGIWMLYRPASLCRLEGRYDNPLPESTISPQSGTKNLATGIKIAGRVQCFYSWHKKRLLPWHKLKLCQFIFIFSGGWKYLEKKNFAEARIRILYLSNENYFEKYKIDLLIYLTQYSFYYV